MTNTVSATQSSSGMCLPLPKRLWWPWTESAERVGFDCVFAISTTTEATLVLSTSGTFRIWLDGRRLSFDVPGLPTWRTVCRIPTALVAGTHRLSIEVDAAGQEQAYLVGCLDWEDGDGLCRLATDAAWMMSRNPAAGWALRALDDSWRQAWAFDGVWAEPWGMPCNAPDDWCRLTTGWQIMDEEQLTSSVCVHQGLVPKGGRAVCSEEGVLELQPVLPFAPAPPAIPQPRPRLEWYRTREAHSLVNNSWLDLFEHRAPHIVLDVGSETFARVQLQLRQGGPAVLALTTGESRNEVDRYDRRVTDVVKLENGETFSTSPTGFRYVKVTALSSDGGPVVLEPVAVQHIRYPAEARGRFHCSDGQLNAVWGASVRTAHLCMQNEIWDGVKRDQLPWMGDLYVEALVAYHLFGDARLARRSYSVLGQLGPAPSRPLAMQAYPGLQAIWRTAGGDINDIPTYTLWWLVGLADYVRYSGDLSLVRDLIPELVATLQHLAGRVEPDGFWRAHEGWDLVDWAPLSEEERFCFTHLLACQAMGLGIRLLADVGRQDPDLADAHARMLQAARRVWLDRSIGFGLSHHTNAMAIRSGLLTREEAEAIFSEVLSKDAPVRMTYWHRYADLDAAMRVGDVTWGLDYIRHHWGPAVDAGYTTLWETFDAAWLEMPDPHAVTIVGSEHARYGGYETSLCHGWSAGPIPWLHQAVLGVRPAADGFASVVFSPNLGDLSWAEGVVPTPLGDIAVKLTCGEHTLQASIFLPRATDLIIPDQVRNEWELCIERV